LICFKKYGTGTIHCLWRARPDGRPTKVRSLALLRASARAVQIGGESGADDATPTGEVACIDPRGVVARN